MGDVVVNARGIAPVGGDSATKAGGTKRIERSPDNTWATTRASSGALPSLGADTVSDMPISVPSSPRPYQPVPVCRDAQALKMVQKQSGWAKVFRIITTVVAFPFLLAFNMVAIPLAYAVAYFSKEWGDGGLAESMGRSRPMRALWGDGFAEWLAHGDGGTQGGLAVLCFFLPMLLVKSAVFSASGAAELFDKFAAGFPEHQWAPRAESIYDTWTKDQGVLAPRYCFQSRAWAPVR